MTDSLLKRKCGLCTDIKPCNFDGCIDDLNEQFKQDKEICDAATEGPWVYDSGNGQIETREYRIEICDRISNYDRKKDLVYRLGKNYPITLKDSDNDMDFIAAARTRWPAALDRIEELEAENTKLREALQKIAEYKDPWHSAHHEAGIDPVQVRIAREALKE